ncbi:MAG: UTP--glucose-1-phosphate uridylyltransferase [Deltaproteobacteria bacterium]|nr:UTP--glucose-1-phosphate uridylyltransferase [Deltaproteobacteria bacterium]
MENHSLSSLNIDSDEKSILSRYGFDVTTFTKLRTKLKQGEFSPESNIELAPISPPQNNDLMPWPIDDATRHTFSLAGQEAINSGDVAVVILNGGMATRFGGIVKGVVEVLPNLSFIGLKLRDILKNNSTIPVFLMCSFATEHDTLEHLDAKNYFGFPKQNVHLFSQRISIRLTLEGELLRDQQNRISLYAPGHGDIFECLHADPNFQAFVASGGKHVFISNVDNIGAALSPIILGAHLYGGKAVTVEVVKNDGTDTGGAPVRIRGGLEILEGFRFPKDFPVATLPAFNTNTMLVDVDTIRPDYPFTWFRADKKVDGAQAVQFERLMGQITSFCSALYLIVPRHDDDSRFQPVKTQEDLVNLKEKLLRKTKK